MYIYIKNITKWNEDWQLKGNDGSYCVSLSFRKLTESILIGVELAPPPLPPLYKCKLWFPGGFPARTRDNFIILLL